MSGIFDEVSGTEGVLADWALMTKMWGGRKGNDYHNTSHAPLTGIPPINPFLYAFEAEAVATGGNAAPINPTHAYWALKVVIDCADL